MEVVAAVSSIAGIATLLGQSLDGLSSLYSFFKDCRDASKTIDRFLQAITSLERTIQDVEGFVNSVKHVSHASTESNLASLAIHMEDCTKDIDRWLKEAQSCHPGYGPWTKSIFKKFLIAVKKQNIKDVFQEITTHRESISLILITTGRLLDIQHLNEAGVLHHQVDEIAGYSKVTVQALGRLETRFQRFDLDEHENRRSLSSIASQLSRIESLLSVGTGNDSSPVAPNFTKHSPLIRTASTSSLYPTCSGSPLRSGILLNSGPPSPTGVGQSTINKPMQRASEEVETAERDPTLLSIVLPPISALFKFCDQKLESRNDSLSSNQFREPKCLEGGGISDFFYTFECLVAYAGGSTSQCLTEYIRHHQVAENTRAHVRMLSAIAPYLNLSESSTMFFELQEAQEKTQGHLRRLEFERDRYRGACWTEGYDVDELDRALKPAVAQDTITDVASDMRLELTPDKQYRGWWDVLQHTRPQNWLTKKDRINSWLLQNLSAQPSEALHHRRCLHDIGIGDQLSEEEWARLVLKFWAIDDAAQQFEHTNCSTNGAVNSDGACHSIRVKLFGSLPIREKLDVMDIDSESEDSAMDFDAPRKRKRRDE